MYTQCLNFLFILVTNGLEAIACTDHLIPATKFGQQTLLKGMNCFELIYLGYNQASRSEYEIVSEFDQTVTAWINFNLMEVNANRWTEINHN